MQNAIKDATEVPSVHVLNVVLKSRFKYCLNNQKPGSFTCEQNILPAVMLSIINVGEYGTAEIKGSAIANVVIAATVALPKAILRTAAITKLITKGDRFKLLVRVTISSVIFESTKTCFKPPAAPLIKSTTAIFLIDELNIGVISKIFLSLDFINIAIATTKLINNAVTGLLITVKKAIVFGDTLGIFNNIVGRVIKITGSKINNIEDIGLIAVFFISNKVLSINFVFFFGFISINFELVNSIPPIIAVGIATIRPYKKTSPIFKLKVLTIILGLGCGGNSAWTVRTPILVGRARYSLFNSNSRATDKIIGITKIKATSKNNEKLMHIPATNKPNWILLTPNKLINFFDAISTAPSSSKIFPNIAPKANIKDKWPNNVPVPFSIESIKLVGDNPNNNPKINATINIERNGSNRNLVIKNIKTLIPKNTIRSL